MLIWFSQISMGTIKKVLLLFPLYKLLLGIVKSFIEGD